MKNGMGGIGIIVIVGLGLWAWSRSKPAEAAAAEEAAELSDYEKAVVEAYKGTIYEGMTEEEAMDYYERLQEEARARHEASVAKAEAARAEMEQAIAEVEAAGYTTTGGIPEAYFVEKYGPAWAWSVDTPGRVEAMRDYWLTYHPTEPLPEALRTAAVAEAQPAIEPVVHKEPAFEEPMPTPVAYPDARAQEIAEFYEMYGILLPYY